MVGDAIFSRYIEIKLLVIMFAIGWWVVPRKYTSAYFIFCKKTADRLS